MSARSLVWRGPDLPGVGCLPAADRGTDAVKFLECEGLHGGPLCAECADVADRVGGEGAVAHGHGQHLFECGLRAFGIGGVSGCGRYEEWVEAADGGLADAQVADCGANGGAQEPFVSIDGLRRQAFLGEKLGDPQFTESRDPGVRGDVIV
jgi:hypothetical protein